MGSYPQARPLRGAATARATGEAEPSGHHGKVADVLWFALETKAETIRNCPYGSAMPMLLSLPWRTEIIIYRNGPYLLQTAFPAWIYARINPKGGAYEKPPFPEVPCVICSKPVDLRADLSADENGKAVHTELLRLKESRPTERPIYRYDGGLKP